ncbi:hypothetical protein ALC53_06657 [Atta colombica]|uniref:Uncharacterized protein n=1 Tax=Atta colombica TaxID=520822 RepID=A0A195BFK0_9HYME|nr:hypothetical protein ALC53_06657 [Atta colombica]
MGKMMGVAPDRSIIQLLEECKTITIIVKILYQPIIQRIANNFVFTLHLSESSSSNSDNNSDEEYEDSLNTSQELEILYSILMGETQHGEMQKHCPSCHCPPERQRFFSPGKPRTLENVEAMIYQCERVFTEPISYQEIVQFFDAEIYWHDYQIDSSSLQKIITDSSLAEIRA